MAYTGRDRVADSYRPSYQRDNGPPPPPSGMFEFHGAAGRTRNNNDNHTDFTFRAGPKIANRPLLRTRRGSREEQVFNRPNGRGDKFRNVEELTDSDEAEMEDSDEERDNGPSAKRARIEDDEDVKDVAETEKPKWSNPDVYTSLPAPCETTGKKIDFVKLIRKARNASAKSTDLVSNNEDFISFEDAGDTANSAPSDAPTGPRAQDTGRTLGKRKRGDSTGVKLISRRGVRFYEDGMVLDEWRARDSVHPTPWLRLHQGDAVGLALHKEILDFYEWVRPRDYEFEVRAGVIKRVAAALNRIEPGELKAFGSYAAGLYLPTGDMDLVYLPRGFNHRKGPKVGISPSQFRKYGDFIKRSGIIQNGSLSLIPWAKVPIIKFVEKVSGLKVDLSFNNDTGVVAVETFQRWREQYPAMPIIVAVIKQFLMIRGLNDVAVGGLGGFSVICLVTSILQHMPLSGTSPNLGQMLIEFFNIYGNLFDRYNVGIRLEPPGYVEKESYGPLLRTNEKESRLLIIDPNRADNNISGGTSEIETIFSCFSRAHEVLQNRLADYEEHDSASGYGFSFLQDLIGGNFNAYQIQREILHGLHYSRTGPAPAVIPPPPPPVSREPLPPPPPPPLTPPPPPPPPQSNPANQKPKSAKTARGQPSAPTSSDEGTTSAKSGPKKTTKAERRATRLKMLRPDIAPLVGNSISLQDAVLVGKYRDYNEMDRDLTQRERDVNGS